jgi:hypothetical protein
MNRDGYSKKAKTFADGGEVDEAAKVKGEAFESENDAANVREGRNANIGDDTRARAMAFLARGASDDKPADAVTSKPKAALLKSKPAAAKPEAKADAPDVKSSADAARKPGIYEGASKWNGYRNEATGNQSSAESNRLAGHKRVDTPRGESKQEFAASRDSFDSKTLLPKRYADGGMVYGKKR